MKQVLSGLLLKTYAFASTNGTITAYSKYLALLLLFLS